ncbi:DEAD/DEAH box helicase [Rhizobium ruizarguesonis]|uniref:DEAD/DEAH box helicase n=2 Tax=Rhizobium TaxID=379 RepID=UPI001038C872|nr:AAA domain-containing protein [Rhizobium ruizarguesonis]NEH37243.1 helicase [Rhizobium ruizarguesonis]NEJ32669.1 helicase [Rhizobium ruizarguesonis]TBY89587.1 helicase [Rhizobium leguminosarum bv. viciae]TCB46626.1 helicase [Rhizobium leguminosarum bv. viciae]
MAGLKGPKNKPLDAIYRFSEDAYTGDPAYWTSQLRHATGISDGEQYLVRLFRKTGTAIDGDLRHLLDRGLRRIHRVLTSRRARDVLVEVIEVAEDEQEIGVVMLRPGDPLSGSTHRARMRSQQLLTTSGRQIFWRNMQRIAEGLSLCHDAGIVHGAISPHTIFSNSDDIPDYRLGGYEWCIQIAESHLDAGREGLRSAGVVSFRQDWIDVGKTARTILGMDSPSAPLLSSIEFKMLDRLTNPPVFQLFDGRTVIREIKDVIEELDRVGVGSEGELILYPSRQVMLSDLPSLTSGTIPASETERVLRFAADDLLGPEVRAVSTSSGSIRLVTDIATYHVRPEEGRIGTITGASMRRNDDRVADAFEIKQRIHLASNRGGAEERAKRAGLAAIGWAEIASKKMPIGARDDPPSWYALILLEAYSLLRQQFHIYPVKVVAPPDASSKHLVWVTPREDEARDERRRRMELRGCAEALERELYHDQGGADWTLASSDALAGLRERQPELSFEAAETVGGARLYAFASSEPVLPGQLLYLRPRKDVGLEQAVRRRLQNIVAARNNVELLRAIDDPAQVAVDEALVEVAAPGQAPSDMDASKVKAWASVAAGKSISLVVGPPGVGKTFLISKLVESIHLQAKRSRILISAQNHETLVNMEHELKEVLPSDVAIVVRVERSKGGAENASLRSRSLEVLGGIHKTSDLAIMTPQFRQIEQTLRPAQNEGAIAERVLRDTDTLLLRASNVTLATTSSHVIEEMIADGEQFDWVFVEEAARANGSELIGALLLGNRRVIIGDHKQLSPFDTVERQKLYDATRSEEILRDARKQLAAFSDLPAEVDQALELLEADGSLRVQVLALAMRLEEPFRSIATREEEREQSNGYSSSIVATLLEQSRMHPAICRLVSNTFYKGNLVPTQRVIDRKSTLMSMGGLPTSPVVVLNVPALSTVKRRAFEENRNGSYVNLTECAALIEAVKRVHTYLDQKGNRPTVVFLAPYWAQVKQLERMLSSSLDTRDGTLFGFDSPRKDGRFVYTSDSFQGGQADVVAASLVRNNTLVGGRALGHVRSPQRMNVMLSRAKQKLILATSLTFLRDASDGTDPDHLGGQLGFVRTMINELEKLAETQFGGVGSGATIIPVDDAGRLVL